MKNHERFLSFPETQLNKKNDINSPDTGITRRLLEKYKLKKNHIVINDDDEKGIQVNIAA